MVNTLHMTTRRFVLRETLFPQLQFILRRWQREVLSMFRSLL
jgi:hypothetical protein